MGVEAPIILNWVIDNIYFTVLNTNMALNKGDLKQIRVILQNELVGQEKRISIRVDNQKEEILEQIDNKLTKLRSDFFERVDPILKEVVTAREERPLIENRLEALEEIHPQSRHTLAS